MRLLKTLATLAALAVLVLPVANCTTGGTIDKLVNGVKNPVDNTRFVTVEAAYAIVLTGANEYIENYRKGYKCRVGQLESATNLCSRRSVVIALQNGIRKAETARAKAAQFIRNNPTLNAGSLIDAFEAASESLKLIAQGDVS